MIFGSVHDDGDDSEKVHSDTVHSARCGCERPRTSRCSRRDCRMDSFYLFVPLFVPSGAGSVGSKGRPWVRPAYGRRKTGAGEGASYWLGAQEY